MHPLQPPFQVLRRPSRALEHAHALFQHRIHPRQLQRRLDYSLSCTPSLHFCLASVFCLKKIYESLVVNEYLAEKFPPGGEYDPSPLLPASPADKAKVRIVASRSSDLVTAYFTYLSNKDEVRWRPPG